MNGNQLGTELAETGTEAMKDVYDKSPNLTWGTFSTCLFSSDLSTLETCSTTLVGNVIKAETAGKTRVFATVQGVSTERGGFEPPVGFDPHAALAKRCYRPLSHLSGPAWTDDIYSRGADESKADVTCQPHGHPGEYKTRIAQPVIPSTGQMVAAGNGVGKRSGRFERPGHCSA